MKRAIVNIYIERSRNFQNDMTSINSRDDVLTLLVHLGYLAFDDDTQEVNIPNEEILEEFRNTLDEHETEAVIAMFSMSSEQKNAIFAQDELAVAKTIDSIHTQLASIIKYNDENSLAVFCQRATFNYKAKRLVTLLARKGVAKIACRCRSQNKISIGNIDPIIMFANKYEEVFKL